MIVKREFVLTPAEIATNTPGADGTIPPVTDPNATTELLPVPPDVWPEPIPTRRADPDRHPDEDPRDD